MYCPQCGKENNQDQKYCRSCGLSLQPVVRAVKGDTSPVDGNSAPVQGLSRAQALWQNPFIYGLFMIALGLIIEVIGDKGIGSGQAADIGGLIAVLGTALIGLKGVMLVIAPSRSRASSAAPPPRIEEPARLTLLSGDPPSVTESTTRQLDAVIEGQERRRDTQPTS